MMMYTMEYTDEDYRRMGYCDKADYERQHRRSGVRFKGPMSEDNVPTKKQAESTDSYHMPKDNDYTDNMEY